MEIVNIIVNFFTDNTKRLTTKAATFLAVIIMLLFIDNIFSFTFYNNIDKKLTYIEKANKLIADSSSSVYDKEYLIEQKELIIKRTTIKDFIWNIVKNSSNQLLNNTKSISLENTDNRNKLIHFTTSSLLLLVIMVILPFITYLDRSLGFLKATLVVVIGEFIMYAACLMVSKLLYYIPIILQKPLINYCINLALNLIVVIIMYKYSNKKSKSNL